MSTYEPCVIDANGNCKRWSHNHETTRIPSTAEDQCTCGRILDCQGRCPRCD